MHLSMHRQLLVATAIVSAAAFVGCSGSKVEANAAQASPAAAAVGVAPVVRRPIARQITFSSELVPFQEIDVYAKESGYIKELRVDYGTRVEAYQSLATLEIPELQSQLKQD